MEKYKSERRITLRIKKYAKCSNTNLLNDYGIGSIGVHEILDKNCNRLITPSGVEQLQEGVKSDIDFSYGNYRDFNPMEEILSRKKDVCITQKSDCFSLGYKVLVLSVDYKHSTMELYEKLKNVITIYRDDLSFSPIHFPLCSLDVGFGNITDILKNHISDIHDTKIKKALKNAFYVLDMNDYEGFPKEKFIIDSYKLNYHDKFELFSKKTIKEYANLFLYTPISRSLNFILNYAFPIKDVTELVELNGIPMELTNCFKIYSIYELLNEIRGCFVGYNKYVRKDWDKLPDAVKNTIVEEIEHKNIPISGVNNIFHLLKIPEEDLEYFPKYIMKYGSSFGTEVFSKYVDDDKFLRENMFDISNIVNARKMAYLYTIKILEKRKYPKERIDLFIDMMDKDVMKAMRLLKTKGKLHKKDFA